MTSKLFEKHECIVMGQSHLVVVIFIELLDQFRITLPVSLVVSFGECSSLDNELETPRIPLSEHRLPEAEHPVQFLCASRRISDL